MTHQPQIVDIIVIGSGFAGLSTAIEAAMGNAELIVLENMKAVGGNQSLAIVGSQPGGRSNNEKRELSIQRIGCLRI